MTILIFDAKIFLTVFLSLSAPSFCFADVSSRTIRNLKTQVENLSDVPIVQTLNGLVGGFTVTSAVTQTDVDVYVLDFTSPKWTSNSQRTGYWVSRILI